LRHYISLAFILIIAMLFMLSGCDSPVTGGATPTSGSQGGTASPGRSAGSEEAAAYCTSKGGQVVTRYPTYDAYAENPLRLSGSLQFCQFTADDESMIAISLDTLYTDQPTLAALAYLQKPPMGQTANPSANPASAYCTKLGGSDLFGGENATGGGWVLDDKNDPFFVLETCIFPDLSTIDSWGLTYHSNEIIRGTDLSKVIRYQMPGTPAPGLFGR
jgi:putative hemolysin